jgi:hypothetical protein
VYFLVGDIFWSGRYPMRETTKLSVVRIPASPPVILAEVFSGRYQSFRTRAAVLPRTGLDWVFPKIANTPSRLPRHNSYSDYVANKSYEVHSEIYS